MINECILPSQFYPASWIAINLGKNVNFTIINYILNIFPTAAEKCYVNMRMSDFSDMLHIDLLIQDIMIERNYFT